VIEFFSQVLADQLCPVQQACGGCPLLGLDAARQRVLKADHLRRVLEQVNVAWCEPEWLSDGLTLGYRNRIRLRFDAGLPVFFNRNKALACAAMRSELQRAVTAVSAWAVGFQAQLCAFEHLEVRAPDADGLAGVQLSVKSASAGLPALAEPSLARLEAPPGVALGQPGYPTPWQRFVWSAGVYSYTPLASFMQVNTGVNDRMISHVQAVARSSRAANVLDLYCGSGTFALSLLAAGLRVTAVEVDRPALAAFTQAAAEQELTQLRVLPGDVAAVSQDLLVASEQYDLVVANPPRAGLGANAGRCASLARHEFLLCCCKAESFARDSAALLAAGFQLRELTAIDMFPGTQHLEVMGRFSR
jgi:tRNA/tmRNA/rRNA uracil-C5-methylase (TrmA/RlmC/RlmD family)